MCILTDAVPRRHCINPPVRVSSLLRDPRVRMPCRPGFEQFTTGIPDTICTANNTEAVYTSVGSYALPIARYDLTCADGGTTCVGVNCAALYPLIFLAVV